MQRTKPKTPPLRALTVRHLTAVIMAVACAAAITACGGSSSKKPQAPSHSAFLAFSACMRTHGVPNFPDPSAQGGIQISSSSGINPFSPSFKAAQSACRKLLPGGGPGGGKPTAQDKSQMLAISECMRAHGVTGFPDPTTTPPSGPGQFSQVLGHDGLFLAVPNTIDTSAPAYQKAARTCNFG